MKEKISIKNMRSKIGLSKVVVFIAFSMLSFLIATFFAPIVSSDATTNTTTAGNSVYFASISANDSVSIPVTPSSEPQIFSGKNTIFYTNTCPSGLTISISTNDNTTSLVREGSDSLQKEIPTLSSAGTALSDNTWGYTIGSGTTSDNTLYNPIPSKASPAVLFNATTANTVAKTLDVTYAIKINDSVPSGTYSNSILYSVAVDSACLTYKVNWDFGGGTEKAGAVYPDYLMFGEIIDLSELTPIRTGYQFDGWYDVDGSKLPDGPIDINPSNRTSVTITAHWKNSTPRITLDSTWNNEDSTTAGTSIIYEKQGIGWYSDSEATQSITEIPIMPTKTGYAFYGYYTQPNCNGEQIINVVGATPISVATFIADTTLYACWEDLGITEMQNMSSKICSTILTNATATLEDSRDKNIYSFFKSVDGSCWMSQNLRLIGKIISSSDSNISASSWTVPNNNWTDNLNQADKNTNAYTYDTNNSDYGVYYNYAAATAGTTSGTSNSAIATQDICPKGWHLPTWSEDDQEMTSLLPAYNIGNNATGSIIMQSRPLSFVKSGFIEYNKSVPTVGTLGAWWTSYSSNTTKSTYFYLNDTNAALYTDGGGVNRYYGLSIRCVSNQDASLEVILDSQSATTSGTGAIYGKPTTDNWYDSRTVRTAITEIPTMPTKVGYIFNGYYTKPECSGIQIIDFLGKIIVDKSMFTDDSTTTIYACWQNLGITTMQAMTPTICSNIVTNATATLQDSRDQNNYTIFKGVDGSCWMSQNLRLVGTTIHNTDSNIETDSFVVPDNNWGDSVDAIEKVTGAYTYNTGDNNYGIYYNYVTASAGTVSGTSNTAEATQDICPKNWHLPSQSEATTLLPAYNIGNNTAGSIIMQSRPLNFTISGFIEYNKSVPTVGTSGVWWTSTAYGAVNRYYIAMSSSAVQVAGGSSVYNYYGLSVRCVTQ